MRCAVWAHGWPLCAPAIPVVSVHICRLEGHALRQRAWLSWETLWVGVGVVTARHFAGRCPAPHRWSPVTCAGPLPTLCSSKTLALSGSLAWTSLPTPVPGWLLLISSSWLSLTPRPGSLSTLFSLTAASLFTALVAIYSFTLVGLPVH